MRWQALALILTLHFIWAAQTESFGCDPLTVVGLIGPNDFVLGVYDRQSLTINARAVYKSRLAVPTAYPEPRLRGSPLFLFWSSEQDWSIATSLDATGTTFAYNPTNQEVPELVTDGWFVRRGLDTTSRFTRAQDMRVHCYADETLVGPASLSLDLRLGWQTNLPQVLMGGNVTMECTGTLSNATQAYNVLLVSTEGFLNCDAASAVHMLAFVGTCTPGQTLHIPINTNQGLPFTPGTANFISTTGGHGAVFAAPDAAFAGEPGTGGVCGQEHMKVRLAIVRDTTPPVVRCPSDVQASAEPGRNGATVTWTPPDVSDNIDRSADVQLSVAGVETTSFYNIGQHIIVYTATDSSSNTASCSFTVTVIDTQPPIFTRCPADIYVSSAETEAFAAASWARPVAADNDQILHMSATHKSGDVFPLGATHVRYTATDTSGLNATCSFSVHVGPPPAVGIVAPPSTSTVRPNAALVLSAWAQGQPPLSFTWIVNGANASTAPVLLLAEDELDAVNDIVLRLRDSSRAATTSGPLRILRASPAVDDNPPVGTAFVSVTMELSGPQIDADTLLSSSSPASQALCSVLEGLLSDPVTSCLIIDASSVGTRLSSISAALVTVRVQTASPSAASSLTSSLVSTATSSSFARALENRNSHYEHVAVYVEAGTATSVITHSSACEDVSCSLSSISVRLTATDVRSTAISPACTALSQCLQGGCAYDLHDRDLTSCTRAGDEGACFAGQCTYTTPPQPCTLSKWSSWHAAPSPPLLIERQRTVLVPARFGGECDVTRQTIDCTDPPPDTSASALAACTSLSSTATASTQPGPSPSSSSPAPITSTATTNSASESSLFSRENIVYIAVGVMALVLIVLSVVIVLTFRRTRKEQVHVFEVAGDEMATHSENPIHAALREEEVDDRSDLGNLYGSVLDKDMSVFAATASDDNGMEGKGRARGVALHPQTPHGTLTGDADDNGGRGGYESVSGEVPAGGGVGPPRLQLERSSGQRVNGGETELDDMSSDNGYLNPYDAFKSTEAWSESSDTWQKSGPTSSQSSSSRVHWMPIEMGKDTTRF